MKTILDEIKAACQHKLYYLAIMLCLTLPDICAALEASNGETSEKQYKAWFDKWLAPKYGEYMKAQDMYRLRCGVLHQGKMGHPGLRYKRVAFALPLLWHKNFLPKRAKPEVLNLGIGIFCKDVVDSVKAWETAHEKNLIVQGNLSRLIRYHPNGLQPYLEGIPCVT